MAELWLHVPAQQGGRYDQRVRHREWWKKNLSLLTNDGDDHVEKYGPDAHP